MTNHICDLPHDLVGGMILSKVPVTTLREVRSTCKLWNRLSKNWIVGKAAAKQNQFLGFMTIDFKVCSLRFPIHLKEEEELVALGLSIKQVDLLNKFEISKVFQCNGLLLCVARDNSKLIAWNPYLGQTRSIGVRTDVNTENYYLFGCDVNGNYKILRFWFLDYRRKQISGFEIYNFSSNSWRILEIRPDWNVGYKHRGVSLKGNSYFWAKKDKKSFEGDGTVTTYDWEDFLLCFDFTTERFGQRLPLPFHSFSERTVTLASVRDEKLALLHVKGMVPLERIKGIEIWVTTKIEPNDVSWSKFMKVDMRPLIGDRCVQFREQYGSFFIDEEKKVAVVFDLDEYGRTKTPHYHTAFIIGEDGYYRTVSLGEASDIRKPPYPSNTRPRYSVCSSSYLPSLVQLSQPRKRKERDES